jgi:hypothetical protein
VSNTSAPPTQQTSAACPNASIQPSITTRVGPELQVCPIRTHSRRDRASALSNPNASPTQRPCPNQSPSQRRQGMSRPRSHQSESAAVNERPSLQWQRTFIVICLPAPGIRQSRQDPRIYKYCREYRDQDDRNPHKSVLPSSHPSRGISQAPNCSEGNLSLFPQRSQRPDGQRPINLRLNFSERPHTLPRPSYRGLMHIRFPSLQRNLSLIR